MSTVAVPIVFVKATNNFITVTIMACTKFCLGKLFWITETPKTKNITLYTHISL